MPTIICPLGAAFGAALSGHAASVRYAVTSAGGLERVAATGAGVAEAPDAAGNATTGLYRADVALDPAWLPCRVAWTIVGQAGVAADETVGLPVAGLGPGALDAIVTEGGLTLWQALSLLATERFGGTTAGPDPGQPGTATVAQGGVVRVTIDVDGGGYRAAAPTVTPPVRGG